MLVRRYDTEKKAGAGRHSSTRFRQRPSFIPVFLPPPRASHRLTNITGSPLLFNLERDPGEKNILTPVRADAF